MRAEYYAGDQLNTNKPVTVIKVDYTSRIITLRFDDGTQSFEIQPNDERLHPIGYSDQGYHNFMPPDGFYHFLHCHYGIYCCVAGLNDTIFYWPDYLAAAGTEGIPLLFFSDVRDINKLQKEFVSKLNI